MSADAGADGHCVTETTSECVPVSAVARPALLRRQRRRAGQGAGLALQSDPESAEAAVTDGVTADRGSLLGETPRGAAVERSLEDHEQSSCPRPAPLRGRKEEQLSWKL